MELAFDTEFITSRKVQKQRSVQFSDGKQNWIFYDKDSIKQFLIEMQPDYLIGFNALCDIGTLELFFDEKFKKHNTKSNQIRARFSIYYPNYDRYGISCRPKKLTVKVMDIITLCQQLGLGSLAKSSAFLVKEGRLKEPKLSKKWLNYPNHHKRFEDYAKHDAFITYKMWEFLKELGVTTGTYSFATVSKLFFDIPKRNPTRHKRIIISSVERRIGKFCFAGRNECFQNGFHDYAYYNDVSSLYPASMLITKCLTIDHIEKCKFEDLALPRKLDDVENYGWIDGVFSSDNDLWGLPIRMYDRNYYIKGFVQGLYNTFDLVSANAKIHQVYKCYKPVFRKGLNSIHNKYLEKFMEKRSKNITIPRKKYLKSLLNTLSGKLGQQRPVIARHTNFPAYSTLLAYSHYIMRWLMNDCHGKIIGMDTDSIFSNLKMEGEFYNINNIPIEMDLKGEGKLFFARSKMYAWVGTTKYKNAWHGWRYNYKDYPKLINEIYASKKIPNKISILMQKKKTLKTREKSLANLPSGYWFDIERDLSAFDILMLMKCDDKRSRYNFNSLELLKDRQFSDSISYTSNNLPCEEIGRRKMLQKLKYYVMD